MKVSALITTFNQEAFIAATLVSVLEQTRAADEIVVVDDGSSDGTWDVVQDTVGTLPQARLLRQPNRGVAAARNAAVAAASGDVLALLDGDDLWSDRKLEVMSGVMKGHPTVGLAADSVWFFHDDPVATRTAVHGEFDRDPQPGDVAWIGNLFDDLLVQNPISSTSQVCVRREVLEQVGPSDPRLPIGSDYHLYLRIAQRFPIALIAEPFTWWRQRDGSASGVGPQRMRNYREETVKTLMMLAAAGGDRTDAYREAARRSAIRSARLALADRHQGRVAALAHVARLSWESRSLRSAILTCAVPLPYRVSGLFGLEETTTEHE